VTVRRVSAEAVTTLHFNPRQSSPRDTSARPQAQGNPLPPPYPRVTGYAWAGGTEADGVPRLGR
jgi:hypothetical protein